MIEIKYIKITDIKPYAKNPRRNDDSVEKVAESIKKYGFKVPLVLSKDHEIVTGHTRYKAAIKLGLTEIPCIIASDLNKKQLKEFRLVDNKVQEYSKWDFELLSGELDGFDLGVFGFEEPEFIDAEIIDDEEDKLPKKRNVKAKTDKTRTIDTFDSCEIWQLGSHLLLVGEDGIYSEALEIIKRWETLTGKKAIKIDE